MQDAQSRGWVLDFFWLLGWGLASSLWCVTAAGQLSAIFDEPTYVSCGLERWRTGYVKGLMRLGTMPLPVDAQTLPLYLRERQRGEPFDPDADLELLLPWARAATLGFWWLLLLYAWRSGRELAGPWGGRLAIALVASQPVFLAHASLATTDIAISACLLALVYHFRSGRDAGWVWRLGLPAFWFAASVLAKASGLVFGPLCLLAVEIERLAHVGSLRRSPGMSGRDWLRHVWQQLRPLRHDAKWIIGGGLALVFLYCGSDWTAERSFVKWAQGLPEGPSRTAAVYVAENLRIFSNAGEGLLQQIKHNARGHGTYLLGQSWPRACWYYFPVVLTIKLTVGLLILPLAVGVCRPRALLNWACLTAFALLLLTPLYRVQIGIRLVLPMVVLGTVGLAAAAVRAHQASDRTWVKRLLAGTAALGVVWTAGAAIAVWPQGLCYVNELWGGTDTGYLRVSDTDYDWGQGLKELAAWHDGPGRPPLDVWYYGTDPALKRMPMRSVPLHLMPVRGPEDVLAQVRGHYLAVSTTILYGGYIRQEAHQIAKDFLLSREPVARTTTFFIYDFTREPEPSPRGTVPPRLVRADGGG